MSDQVIADSQDTAFTPGPWWHCKWSSLSGYQIETDIDGVTVLVSTVSRHDDRQRQLANANLVASAPDLFAALTELVRCVRGGDDTAGVSMDDALQDADAALEKAVASLSTTD